MNLDFSMSIGYRHAPIYEIGLGHLGYFVSVQEDSEIFLNSLLHDFLSDSMGRDYFVRVDLNGYVELVYWGSVFYAAPGRALMRGGNPIRPCPETVGKIPYYREFALAFYHNFFGRVHET
tara:strand:+ start:1195 stop:1554 length:360 start_codon:yes stop_codon:yes gene_type:complete